MQAMAVIVEDGSSIYRVYHTNKVRDKQNGLHRCLVMINYNS